MFCRIYTFRIVTCRSVKTDYDEERYQVQIGNSLCPRYLVHSTGHRLSVILPTVQYGPGHLSE